MTSFLSFDPWAELAQSPAPEPAATPPTEHEGHPTFATFATFASLLPESRFFSPDGAAADWREWFEERFAIAMVDGEQAEGKARRIAFDGCIVRWLDLHPASSESDRCAGCGKPDRPANIVPFGADPPGHAWLHPRCWADWHASRRAEAITALAGFGIIEGDEI